MSFKRRISFRRKTAEESPPSLKISEACKQNGKINTEEIILSAMEQGAAVIVTENVETSLASENLTAETVSQIVKDEELGNSPAYNTIATNDLRTDTQSNGIPPQLKDYSSFAIPDGLAMDPLTPNAIAISSEFMDRIGSGLTLLRDHGKKVQKYVWKNRKFDILKKSWKSVVNIVLVEAKDLPDGFSGSNGLYCKFKLGTENHKSKQVSKSKATWCERFNLYQYDDSNLEVTVWHKGKQKNFMGRCTINLSELEKEKTHEFWQELECGFGSIHLLITLSGTARSVPVDNVPTTNGVHHMTPAENKFTWYRLNDDWNEVGQLSVTVHGARGLSALGLSGKADAYCVLELDNSRVQTHTVRSTCEPNWNKSYTFGINDITSTLDIAVYDESIINSIKAETLGKISIPLLRINNDEKKWYALKNRSKKCSAKGNCPRILLEMSIVWNPIKASLRVMTPKEKKYIQKPPKFDIPLIYSNLIFIKNLFSDLYVVNEHYKRLFEWDNREKSVLALMAWLTFCYLFRVWMTPLLLLAPFAYHWVGNRSNNSNVMVCLPTDDDFSDEDLESHKDDKTIKMRLYGLQDLTFTIKNSIDYMVSVLERVINLANFTVPYMSYLAIIILLATSVALYMVPVNYLFMALGIYKFTRKLLNPERIPNNDILDFVSRVPDNEILKEWRELKVPEPNLSRSGSTKRR